MPETPFLFTVCQPGFEPALKRELNAAHPELRFAFSRPGFVTFKWTADQEPSPRLQLKSVFARTWGWSRGPIGGDDEPSWLDTIMQLAPLRKYERLHIWQRQSRRPATGMPRVVTDSVERLGQELRQGLIGANRLASRSELNSEAASGDYVLDVLCIGPDQFWLGWHQVATFGQRWAGGVPLFAVSPGIASRAYLKMREAIAWSGFPLQEGERVIDLGSAPGGTSQALLEIGLGVTGVDPAEMHSSVLEHPNFVHLRKRGADVRRREYRGHRWLVADSNVAPSSMLHTVESIVTHPSTRIQGLLLTLKLADCQMAERIPEFVRRVQQWGYRDVRCRQLASNHQEVCLAALRHRRIRRSKTVG